ncbi:MAG: hypothetical protein LBI03_04430 [Clostridiales bacterium]|jgi:hypothetical protein|nr:hypothetical protein [Clostridiales bacterium]
MNTVEKEPVSNKIPLLNTIEELEKYFHEEILEENKWGIFYPILLSFELFICRIRKLKKEIVWVFQRTVKKHHLSDIEIQNLDFHIAKILLPKLVEFRNQKLHIFPTTKLETWLNILDEIIYAFEWNIYANWEKNPIKERAFYLRYFEIDDQNLDYFHYYDSEIVKKAATRAYKGFELFGKYFTCLWNY